MECHGAIIRYSSPQDNPPILDDILIGGKAGKMEGFAKTMFGLIFHGTYGIK